MLLIYLSSLLSPSPLFFHHFQILFRNDAVLNIQQTWLHVVLSCYSLLVCAYDLNQKNYMTAQKSLNLKTT